MTEWAYISTEKFTCRVELDQQGYIVGAAPILRKFTGQPFTNLKTWLYKRFRRVKIEEYEWDYEGEILD